MDHHHHVSTLEALIELAGSLAYLRLAVIVAAVAAQIVWLVRDNAQRVNAAAFAEQIAKLIAASNIERAIKLCDAARGPLTAVARVGLEARLKGANARDAMREILPRALASARSGLIAVLLLGALGFVEAALLLAKGLEEGSTEGAEVFMGSALLLIGGLAIRNGLRWGAWRTDLDRIIDAVAK
jgi:Na+/H+ antiporter NhaC